MTFEVHIFVKGKMTYCQNIDSCGHEISLFSEQVTFSRTNESVGFQFMCSCTLVVVIFLHINIHGFAENTA